MKRLIRFTVTFVLALILVPFIPLYIERTLSRSWRVDHVGDVIELGLEDLHAQRLLVEL